MTLREKVARWLRRRRSMAVRLDDAYAALRAIAEGNLGDGPGQANYDIIKLVARQALPPELRGKP
jgi:hypothetical protein